MMVRSEMIRTESAADLVLAVDAGGTKTAACLARATGIIEHEILGCGGAGSGNPLSVGVDEATGAIHEAILAARRAANLAEAPVARAVLSVAGAANPEIASQLLRWARDARLAQRVAVVSDMLPILAAGTDDGIGVALIAGTGSVAMGRAADGRTIRCGGWGYLLGDGGSGYWIGRAAIRLVLADFEAGAGPQQPLVVALAHEMRAGTVIEAVTHIYASANPRALIASLTPVVVNAAENGDHTARKILDGAADDLAALVARTARALGLAGQPFPLAAAGGVLVHSKFLRERVATRLAAEGIHADLRVVTDPLAGCLRLAEPDHFGSLVEWH